MRLLLAKNANARNIPGLFYWCTVKSGLLHPSSEVSEVKFFALDDLPDVRPSDFGFLKQLFMAVESFGYELA